MATTQAALGLKCAQRGDITVAEPFLRSALEFVRAQGGHADPVFRFTVLNDLGGAISHLHPEHRDHAAEIAGELGMTLRALGRTAEANALLHESHGIAVAAYGEAHPLSQRAAARRLSIDR